MYMYYYTFYSNFDLDISYKRTPLYLSILCADVVVTECFLFLTFYHVGNLKQRDCNKSKPHNLTFHIKSVLYISF